ncbi:DUF1559 family PulG-like putative transporter [Paludisphaera soli]|uniref:DUF1559 family PulG-like putative transporter n=1 Tax=Paludisphaera soli TaxID=2712865 RepID=UPI0013EA4207
MTGTFTSYSTIRISGVTDGTSNTFLFGERARSFLAAEDQLDSGWWQNGHQYDTFFGTNFPSTRTGSTYP